MGIATAQIAVFYGAMTRSKTRFTPNDWTSTTGKRLPAHCTAQQGEALIVVEGKDDRFGFMNEQWVERAGANCDDGSELFRAFNYLKTVHIGNVPLRRLHVQVKLVPTNTAFEGDGPEQHEWAVFAGPSALVSQLLEES